MISYFFSNTNSSLYKYLYEFYNRIEKMMIDELIINPVFGVGAFLILLGNFLVEQNRVSFPDAWIENIMLHCAEAFEKKGNPGAAIFRKLMYNCSFFGFYLGILIEIKIMDTYKYPYFAQTSAWVTFKRTIVHLVCAFPFIAIG